MSDMKDILGQILDAKKSKAMTVTINIEPSNESEDQELKAQGMAPVLEAEKEEPKEEVEEPKENDLMGPDEERFLARKKKDGVKPQSLGERAKMYSLDEEK